MHKCKNCGKEYEGNFCPECGTPCEEGKICPECGAKCDSEAKFCNTCGYNFKENISKQSNVGNRASKISVLEKAQKIHKVVEYLPVILFAAFSVALFAIFAAPVAIMPGGELLGEKIPAGSYGNMYEMYNGLYKDIPEIQGVAITIILIAAYSLLTAVALCVTTYIRHLKFKRINIFGIKNAVRLSEIIEWAACFVYILFIVLTSVIVGKISAFDSGLELISSGACVITILVLSCLFLLMHISCRLLEKLFLDKKAPELSVESQGKRYFSGAYAAKGVATPVAPQPVEKPVQYCKAVKIIKQRRAAAVVAVSIILIIQYVYLSFLYGWLSMYFKLILCTLIFILFLSSLIVVLITLFAPVKIKIERLEEIIGKDFCESDFSNQCASYSIYLNFVEQLAIYKLQLYSYLNGKTYYIKKLSKNVVWLYKNWKVIFATVLGYVLYAITVLVILLPL